MTYAHIILRRRAMRRALVLAAAALVLAACGSTDGTPGMGDAGAPSPSRADQVARGKATIAESVRRSDREAGAAVILRAPPWAFLDMLPWLEDRAPSFPPEYLYAMAQRLYPQQRTRAGFWWMAGRTRMLYDGLRCTDRTVGAAAIQSWDSRLAPLVRDLTGDAATAVDTAIEALEWDIEQAPHRVSLVAFCRNGAAGADDRSRWVKTGIDEARLREEARMPLRLLIRKSGG